MKSKKITGVIEALGLLATWFENRDRINQIKAENVQYLIDNDVEGSMCCQNNKDWVAKCESCEVRHSNYLKRQELAKENGSIMRRLGTFCKKP